MKNRIIKFRSWDKKRKTMLFGLSEYAAETISNRKEEEYKLMQYTGLKDRFGKDIYEGDLVKMSWMETWYSG